MPLVFSKTTVWPLAETEGRSSEAWHTADGQNTLTTPVLGLSVSSSPGIPEFSKTMGPLVPVTVTEVGPDLEPKWQTRVLVAGPVAVLVTVPHGTVIE